MAPIVYKWKIKRWQKEDTTWSRWNWDNGILQTPGTKGQAMAWGFDGRKRVYSYRYPGGPKYKSPSVKNTDFSALDQIVPLAYKWQSDLGAIVYQDLRSTGTISTAFIETSWDQTEEMSLGITPSWKWSGNCAVLPVSSSKCVQKKDFGPITRGKYRWILEQADNVIGYLWKSRIYRLIGLGLQEKSSRRQWTKQELWGKRFSSLKFRTKIKKLKQKNSRRSKGEFKTKIRELHNNFM